ncbi:MAG: hypothetical protein ACXWF8_17315 [Methylobacter sp.]
MSRMYPNRKQNGFSLVIAIFLIVVLGGIAVIISWVSTMQHQSSALDEEGSMAYQAARSGIEWGVYQAVINSSCVAGPSTFSLALTVPTTPAASTVNYNVSVACTQTSATEGTTVINIFQITSTARNASNGNFAVERQLSVSVSR